MFAYVAYVLFSPKLRKEIQFFVFLRRILTERKIQIVNVI